MNILNRIVPLVGLIDDIIQGADQQDIKCDKVRPVVSTAHCTDRLQSAIDICWQKKNSVALVRKRTIPTERPPPVGEVSDICWQDYKNVIN